MSSIGESGGIRPQVTTFEPLETGITSKTSKFSPEMMKGLEKSMAKASSDKAELDKQTNDASAPQVKQAALNYFIENEGLAESVGNMAAMAVNPKFTSQPLPGRNELAANVTENVVKDILATGLNVLMAILKDQPSAHVRNAGPYAKVDNALDAGIDSAKQVISKLDPKASDVANKVLTGIEDILGGGLNIADTVSRKGDPASMISTILQSLGNVTKGITEIVAATTNKEVTERVSSVLDTIGKGLEVAFEGIKPGADPFETASKSASIALQQAGKIASTVQGDTSAKVAAILPQVGTITQGILGMASDGVKGTADPTRILQSLGSVIAGTQGLVAATASPQVASVASRALQPVSNNIVIMKEDSTLITMGTVQSDMAEAIKDQKRMESEMELLKGEMAKAEQKATKDKATTNAIVQSVAASATASISVVGAGMSVKGSMKADTPLEQNQSQLASLQDRKVVLNEHMQSGSKPMTPADVQIKNAEIATLQAKGEANLSPAERGDLAALKNTPPPANSPQHARMVELDAQAKASLNAEDNAALNKLQHEVDVRQMNSAQAGGEQQRIKADIQRLEKQHDQIMRDTQNSKMTQGGNIATGSAPSVGQMTGGLGGIATAHDEVEEQKARVGKEAAEQLKRNSEGIQKTLEELLQKARQVVDKHVDSRIGVMQKTV